jgi:hypothetical protein
MVHDETHEYPQQYRGVTTLDTTVHCVGTRSDFVVSGINNPNNNPKNKATLTTSATM